MYFDQWGVLSNHPIQNFCFWKHDSLFEIWKTVRTQINKLFLERYNNYLPWCTYHLLYSKQCISVSFWIWLRMPGVRKHLVDETGSGLLLADIRFSRSSCCPQGWGGVITGSNFPTSFVNVPWCIQNFELRILKFWPLVL